MTGADAGQGQPRQKLRLDMSDIDRRSLWRAEQRRSLRRYVNVAVIFQPTEDGLARIHRPFSLRYCSMKVCAAGLGMSR